MKNMMNFINTITIEGIEDVDISEEAGLTAIQCKYYDKTKFYLPEFNIAFLRTSKSNLLNEDTPFKRVYLSELNLDM